MVFACLGGTQNRVNPCLLEFERSIELLCKQHVGICLDSVHTHFESSRISPSKDSKWGNDNMSTLYVNANYI